MWIFIASLLEFHTTSVLYLNMTCQTSPVLFWYGALCNFNEYKMFINCVMATFTPSVLNAGGYDEALAEYAC